jgi:hypothetical protein
MYILLKALLCSEKFRAEFGVFLALEGFFGASASESDSELYTSFLLESG